MKENLEQKLLDIVLSNKFIPDILDVCEKANLPNWYLAAGCIAGSVWNSVLGNPLEWGINDYDIIYFDKTQKDNLEKVRMIQKLNPEVTIEVVNEAFVHTWIKDYLGFSIEPYSSSEDAMNTWGATASCIGIRKIGNEYKIYAPYGLEDVFNLQVRPVQGVFISELFLKKAEKWKRKWPKLEILGYDKCVVVKRENNPSE